MSYYTIAFVGMSPFGSLLAGALATAVGAPWTVMLSGVCCILGAAWFVTRIQGIRKVMRPIYEQLGIIPAMSSPKLEEDAGGN